MCLVRKKKYIIYDYWSEFHLFAIPQTARDEQRHAVGILKTKI